MSDEKLGVLFENDSEYCKIESMELITGKTHSETMSMLGDFGHQMVDKSRKESDKISFISHREPSPPHTVKQRITTSYGLEIDIMVFDVENIGNGTFRVLAWQIL